MLASHHPHDVGVILASTQDWLRYWWMGTWLLGFRSGLEWLLPLPVPNHGLDGVGRSVQCNHCNIDHHALKNLICQIQSTNTGCLARAVPGWIKHVLDKCRLNVCAVMHGGCCCPQECTVKCLDGKNLCGKSIVVASTHHLGFCHFPSSENTHLILSTLWAVLSTLRTAEPPLAYWF